MENYIDTAKQAINGYPVLLHSPGGAFQRDSGGDALNGPDFLVEQDIIVVTLSYRLGVFGFLSLATPDYSGNMGLKDQQLALKWLSNNIRHFGGDNKRLTLGGFSAGNSQRICSDKKYQICAYVTLCSQGFLGRLNRCNAIELSSVKR